MLTSSTLDWESDFEAEIKIQEYQKIPGNIEALSMRLGNFLRA